jgi:hypothetical protein
MENGKEIKNKKDDLSESDSDISNYSSSSSEDNSI